MLLRKARRGELAEAEADAMRAAMLTLPIRFNAHGPLIQPALALAGIHRLSVYDALYLVLALRHGARLLTRDELLAGVAGRLGGGLTHPSNGGRCSLGCFADRAPSRQG